MAKNRNLSPLKPEQRRRAEALTVASNIVSGSPVPSVRRGFYGPHATAVPSQISSDEITSLIAVAKWILSADETAIDALP